MNCPFRAAGGAVTSTGLPWRPCAGKPTYKTKRDAETARNARLRGAVNKEKGWARIKRHVPDHLRVYYCEECGAWHLTRRRAGQKNTNHKQQRQ